MDQGHYKNEIQAFIDQELSVEKRQAVGEHLLICDECRREHDEVKLGASLTSLLPRLDAPDSVWARIENSLDPATSQMGLIPQAAFWNLRRGLAFAVAMIAVSALSVVVYVSLFSGDSPYTAQRANQNSTTQDQQPVFQVNSETPAHNSNLPANSNVNSHTNTSNTDQSLPPPSGDSWQVETLAGMPKIGDGTVSAWIAVGELLETDAKSKAKITVANIGSVEVAPNSRVKLVETGKDEHRLALERGSLHAKIFAPPRLFVVDTPSGKAVDLGCEYTLDVDRFGNSVLNVTGGFVAMEDRGRESIVPAGMKVMTRKGKGLGTPFSPDTNAEFRRALEQFDFGGDRRAAVQTLISKAEFYDMVTLWHLLSRVSPADRGVVFDKLAAFVPPPSGVTREGISRQNDTMLQNWRNEVEKVWFE